MIWQKYHPSKNVGGGKFEITRKGDDVILIIIQSVNRVSGPDINLSCYSPPLASGLQIADRKLLCERLWLTDGHCCGPFSVYLGSNCQGTTLNSTLS